MSLVVALGEERDFFVFGRPCYEEDRLYRRDSGGSGGFSTGVQFGGVVFQVDCAQPFGKSFPDARSDEYFFNAVKSAHATQIGRASCRERV